MTDKINRISLLVLVFLVGVLIGYCFGYEIGYDNGVSQEDLIAEQAVPFTDECNHVNHSIQYIDPPTQEEAWRALIGEFAANVDSANIHLEFDHDGLSSGHVTITYDKGSGE